MPTLTIQQKANYAVRAAVDHEWFFRDQLGCTTMYDKQFEMIRSVLMNRRTSVCGCNSSGKDFCAGRIIPWWLTIWSEAKVIVLAPTGRQVADIVFREVRQAYIESRVPLGGRMYDTPRLEVEPEKFALGFSTDKPYNIMGFHSPHLLVILSEAHGIDQAHIDAVKRLNPERILMTGNALSIEGEFYDSFHEHQELWNTIQISALDTPNVQQGRVVIPGMVTLEDIEEREVEWGAGSALYLAGVLAQFPANLEDVVVSLVMLRAAVELGLAVVSRPRVGQPTISCDVARFGSDRTVIYSRQAVEGDVILARKLRTMQGVDTMAVTGILVQLWRELNAEAVVVDDGGVGGGVVDRLREQGVPVVPFNFGGRARRPERFANAGTEAWYNIREMCQKGRLALVEDRAAMGQLSGRKHMVQSDGRLMLESKEMIRKRGGRSPDDADALAMACYGAMMPSLQIW